MQNPRSCIICLESDCRHIPSTSDVHDIAPNWVIIVVNTAPCASHNIKHML